MDTLVRTFFYSNKTREDGLESNISFPAFAFMLLIVMILANAFLCIPINEIIVKHTFSSMNIPPDNMNMMLEISYKTRYLQAISNGIVQIGQIFFFPLFIYILGKVLREKITYKMCLIIYLYSYFIVQAGDIINTILLYVKGIENIHQVYEINLMGLNRMFSFQSLGPVMYTLLTYINPFQLFSVLIIYLGLKNMLNIKPAKAIAMSGIFWIITILFPLLSVYYSEVAKNSFM